MSEDDTDDQNAETEKLSEELINIFSFYKINL